MALYHYAHLALEAGLRASVAICWAAVEELILSHYNGEAILITVYTHHGNSIQQVS